MLKGDELPRNGPSVYAESSSMCMDGMDVDPDGRGQVPPPNLEWKKY